MDTSTTITKLLEENNGLIRTSDAANAGVSRTALCELVRKGILERVAHGQYVRKNNLVDELYMLQQRSKKIVFSHETALFLHNISERTPLLHSLTIPNNKKLSPALAADCKIYYIKPELFELGQCIVLSKMGCEVIAYNVERTICDILRSRNRIDSQTFAAAMKSYASWKDKNWNNLRDYAETFRVTKLLRQYLEVLL